MARRLKLGRDYNFLNTAQIANRANKCAEEGLDFVSLKPISAEEHGIVTFPTQFHDGFNGYVPTEFVPTLPPQRKSRKEK